MSDDNFDFDVIVIGSGFGGSVAALRATEKGARVGVMESGKRWNDTHGASAKSDSEPTPQLPEAKQP
jgi:choline dehydrogenase-like flavoprotein